MMTPAVLIRPIELLLVNHRAPSGPAAIPSGTEMGGSVKLLHHPGGC